MELYAKIMLLYPLLTEKDFAPVTGTIVLQNDSDGRGDYIREWDHPTFPKPTDEQLAGVK
jgi:hypothetical protein